MAGWNGATRSQIVRRKVNGAPVMMEKGGGVIRAALPLSIALLSTYIVSNDKVVLGKKKQLSGKCTAACRVSRVQ